MKYYFYTFHRSGSTFLTKVIKDICEYKKINYVFDNDKINPKTLKGNYCFFTRAYRKPNDDYDKIIVNLRDPRDVATSMFFSYCFYHPGNVKPNTGIRKKMADKGIDHFVSKILFDKKGVEFYGTGSDVNVKTKYEIYIDNLIKKENSTLLKYENMVTNFEVWLNDVLISFDIEDKILSKKLFNKYKDSFKVNKENKHNHIRKVTPEDYKDKLKSDTVVHINKNINEVLNILNYEY